MLVGSADILVIMLLWVSLFKQRIVRDRSAAMLHTPTESATSCSVPCSSRCAHASSKTWMRKGRRDGVAAATTATATRLGNDHPRRVVVHALGRGHRWAAVWPRMSSRHDSQARASGFEFQHRGHKVVHRCPHRTIKSPCDWLHVGGCLF